MFRNTLKFGGMMETTNDINKMVEHKQEEDHSNNYLINEHKECNTHTWKYIEEAMSSLNNGNSLSSLLGSASVTPKPHPTAVINQVWLRYKSIQGNTIWIKQEHHSTFLKQYFTILCLQKCVCATISNWNWFSDQLHFVYTQKHKSWKLIR